MTLFLALVLVLLGLFLFYPLVYVFRESLFPEGKFSLVFFGLLLDNPTLRSSIINSVNIACLVTLSSIAVGLPLAAVLVRFQFRGRNLLQALLLLPMIMPPFVGAIGMQHLFARFGSVNLALMDLGLIAGPIDWFGSGFTGVVILEVLHLYPIMVLNLMASLANVDPSLEDMGSTLGASRWRVFRTVTWPLMMPGVFAGSVIVFIWAFTDLGTPLIFEFREVVPVQIFSMVTDIRANPMGYALVVLVILLTLAFFWLSRSVMGEDRFAMSSRGRSSRQEIKPGPALLALIWLGAGLLFCAALLPHLSVILLACADGWFMSIIPEAFTSRFLGNVFLMKHELAATGIRNSLMLSSASAGLDLVFGAGIAYILVRRKFPGRSVLDALSMLPLALPGIVLAFGYVAAFSDTSLSPRLNPMPLLVISYAVRRLPFAVRAAYAGLQQTSLDLEEASANLGAGPLLTFRRITLPLISGNLLAAGILCFAFAMLEVSDSLILAMQEKYYPITKVIYDLTGRIVDGQAMASAMGVLGMFILFAGFLIAGATMGKRMGEMFRIG